MNRGKPQPIFTNQSLSNNHKPSLSTHSSASDESLPATPAPLAMDKSTLSDYDPRYFLQKRVLFVSAIQLYRSYTKIPSFILQNAIFAFAMKRSWILPENQRENVEAQTTYIYHFVSNWSAEFIQIIKSKDQKGHILWIEPCTHTDSMQYWTEISNKLCKIVDLSVSKIITKSPEHDEANEEKETNVALQMSRPSTTNVVDKDTATPYMSISEQILSPIMSCNGFTFTNGDDEAMYTDSDFDPEEDGHSTDEEDDPSQDKSRPSQRDLFKNAAAVYYSPLKLDMMTQIESIESVNELQFCALKELFYQSNQTLIPMEYFDVKMYFGVHLEDKNKYSELLTYCNTHHLCSYRRIEDKGCDSSEHADLTQTKSSTCDGSIISVESNSLLPNRGKIGFDSSREIRLFDSDTNRKEEERIVTAEDEAEQVVSEEDVNHMEYYLSNTIVSTRSSASSRSRSVASEWKGKKKGKRRRNNNCEWSYEAASNCMYRAKGNVLISKQMTNDIIPKRIAEKISQLWQFVDKSSVMSKQCDCRIMCFDFHDAQNGDKLYCVCDSDEMNTNHKWKMRNALYTACQIECEFGIASSQLPVSIRESMQWKADLDTQQKIRSILLNFEKMSEMIGRIKWHKVEVQARHHKKKRMTLAVTCEEFVKNLDRINENMNNEELQLVPVIMFQHATAAYRMEFVWIVRLDGDINIGISLRYDSARDQIEICGIHLDKTYIANQSELVSHEYAQFDFESNITNLHIGNPDDLLNRVKDLQKRNQDLKSEKNEVKQQMQSMKQKYDQLLAEYQNYRALNF